MNLTSQLYLWVVVLFITTSGRSQSTWHWCNPAPHGNNVISLGYHAASGLTIQACDSGQIYTSPDWITWTPQRSQTTNTLEAIAFLGNRILVTGANGTVVYSDDGINYACTNLGTTDWLVGVAASPTLAVAVGDNAAIYTSLDGETWVRQGTPPNVGTRWLLAVAYGGGSFVVVGEGGYIATSRDGTNWAARTVAGLTTDLNAVTWIDSQTAESGLPPDSFLAAGTSGKAILSTSYGTNWTSLVNTGTNLFYSMAGTDSAHLLVGDSTVRLGHAATGLLTWREQVGPGPLAVPTATYYSSLASTSSWAVAGDAGLFITGNPNLSGTVDWTAGGSGVRDWLFQVIRIGDTYVAVGQQSRILTSDNGIDWSVEQVPVTNSVTATNTVFFGVGGSTNLLIAVGNQGSMALSSNSLVSLVTTNSDGTFSTNLVNTLGIIWNPILAPTTNDLHSVVQFKGTNFVCGGTGTILSSADGVDWLKEITPTTAYLSGLESYSGGLVCVGDTGTILTSPDGSTWTKAASGTTNWIFRVRNLGGSLIAVGENGTILTSPDGNVWSAQNSGVHAWLNDAILVSNTCFIAGSDGTILSSTNLSTWTQVPVITENSFYSTASMRGQLVVIGALGTILRNQVIPSTTPIQFLDYSRISTSEYFQAAGDPDESFTLDSSTNLVNWTTGPLFNITDSSGTIIFGIDSSITPQKFYRATLK